VELEVTGVEGISGIKSCRERLLFEGISEFMPPSASIDIHALNYV